MQSPVRGVFQFNKKLGPCVPFQLLCASFSLFFVHPPHPPPPSLPPFRFSPQRKVSCPPKRVHCLRQDWLNQFVLLTAIRRISTHPANVAESWGFVSNADRCNNPVKNESLSAQPFTYIHRFLRGASRLEEVVCVPVNFGNAGKTRIVRISRGTMLYGTWDCLPLFRGFLSLSVIIRLVFCIVGVGGFFFLSLSLSPPLSFSEALCWVINANKRRITKGNNIKKHAHLCTLHLGVTRGVAQLLERRTRDPKIHSFERPRTSVRNRMTLFPKTTDISSNTTNTNINTTTTTTNNTNNNNNNKSKQEPEEEPNNLTTTTLISTRGRRTRKTRARK